MFVSCIAFSFAMITLLVGVDGRNVQGGSDGSSSAI